MNSNANNKEEHQNSTKMRAENVRKDKKFGKNEKTFLKKL